MEAIEFLNSPDLPIDRLNKWGAYVSATNGDKIRSVSADFNTKQEAEDHIPVMRAMVQRALTE